MNDYLVKYFFCEEFVFNKGVWLGNFCFSIEHKQKIYNGMIHCTYKQSTPSPSVQKTVSFEHSFSTLDKELTTKIKADLNEKFIEIFDQLKVIFIEPREQFAVRPKILTFEYVSDKSNEEFWLFNFTLEESPKTKFSIIMELEGNIWYYQISPSVGTLLDFKNSLQWEDFLMDEVIKRIKLVPEIRYKFLYQKVKYKYRKRYR